MRIRADPDLKPVLRIRNEFVTDPDPDPATNFQSYGSGSCSGSYPIFKQISWICKKKCSKKGLEDGLDANASTNFQCWSYPPLCITAKNQRALKK